VCVYVHENVCVCVSVFSRMFRLLTHTRNAFDIKQAISSSYKLSLNLGNVGDYVKAFALIKQSLDVCTKAVGIHTHLYLLGLVALGELYCMKG